MFLPIENQAILAGQVEADRQFSHADPVKVQGLTMKFGKHVAVDEISFSARNGEVFCFLGHNGAGKTTVINMLTGMLKASRGDAIVAGASVNDNLDEVRKSLGLC